MPRSSTNLRLGLGLNGADVDVRARRVVDVVDGDVRQAVGSPRLSEPHPIESMSPLATPRPRRF